MECQKTKNGRQIVHHSNIALNHNWKERWCGFETILANTENFDALFPKEQHVHMMFKNFGRQTHMYIYIVYSKPKHTWHKHEIS